MLPELPGKKYRFYEEYTECILVNIILWKQTKINISDQFYP